MRYPPDGAITAADGERKVNPMVPATIDPNTPTNRDLVVIGASAGGVESLRKLVRHLDPDLPACVLVVLHFPATSASLLPAILNRARTLPASTAVDGEPLRRGHILVARPDYHLLVSGDHVSLTRGPRENGFRPAIDVLFRSAARAAGPRVIGVILSGMLDDGTAGMLNIRQRGGLVLAQSPNDAIYPSMPDNVIQHVGADRIGTVAELAQAVNRLVRTPNEPSGRPSAPRSATNASPSDPSDPNDPNEPDDPPNDRPPEPPQMLATEVEIADMNPSAFVNTDRPGRPSGYSCPDCNGTLFEIDDAGLLRFRCRVGHAWSSLALMAAQSDALEGALWMAFRSLEEKAALSRQLARRAGERGHTLSQQRYLEKASEAGRSALLLQQLLEQPLSTMPTEPIEHLDDSAEERDAERI